MNRGGRGGNGQSVKRKPNTPVGGVYKDQRRGINGDETECEEEEWSVVSYNRKSPQRHEHGQQQPPSSVNESSHQSEVQQDRQERQERQDRPSFASVTAQQSSSSLQNRRNSTASANYNGKKILESKFVTPAPNGSMRDDITVEIQTINGKPFKGSLTVDEAKNGIFVKCLELNPGLLHGLRFNYSGCPVVKFKLKEQIDIDQLHRLEYFEFYRRYSAQGEQRFDTFGCKINGIRTLGRDNAEADPDPSVRWVKIEWAEYSIQKGQILEWLNMYGEQASELTEDVHPNSDSDADPLGAGTYSVKMRLNKEIPQLLPMRGRRIRVYYRGVQKLCSNCFGRHPRKNCRTEKVPWIKYVLNFMESNPDIPQELYGKWWQAVNTEFGEIVRDQEENDAQNDIIEESPNQSGSVNTNTGADVSQRQTRNQTENRNDNSHRQRSQTQSRNETEDLSDYLKIGMTIDEARNAYQKEIEMAEIKQRIREAKRNEQRGAPTYTRKTNIGPGTSRGGRGGLSFN